MKSAPANEMLQRKGSSKDWGYRETHTQTDRGSEAERNKREISIFVRRVCTHVLVCMPGSQHQIIKQMLKRFQSSKEKQNSTGREMIKARRIHPSASGMCLHYGVGL